MSDDAELDLFRQNVNCAAVLEQMGGGWKLDVRESTKRALKFRCGAGAIIIVNHDGRGWWDATSSAKGDVFALVQFLDPSLNFGQVRQVLRPLVGITPMFPAAMRARRQRRDNRPVAERWSLRPKLRMGSPAWAYLASARCLPADVLRAAARQDVVRAGSYGSAWFAHRNREGVVCHVECRGPNWKGSLAGGDKRLFCLGEPGAGFQRLLLTEAPIDTLSCAAIEGCRTDTLYAATGGGMGPGTVEALNGLVGRLVGQPGTVVASATDANTAGDRYAAQHAALAAEAGVPFERLRPPEDLDWNDVIKLRRGA